MTTIDLPATATALFAGGKGLLAMDESNPTCNRRFEPTPDVLSLLRSKE